MNCIVGMASHQCLLTIFQSSTECHSFALVPTDSFLMAKIFPTVVDIHSEISYLIEFIGCIRHLEVVITSNTYVLVITFKCVNIGFSFSPFTSIFLVRGKKGTKL